jgi:hypothetical protein
MKMFVLCKSGTLDFNRGFFDSVETDMPGLKSTIGCDAEFGMAL